MFDYLIVGCGLAGVTCARLLAENGYRVLIIDRRNHIGGNVYDYYNEDGILVHKYGPHIFHTQHRKVWDFLSRFTQWHYYQHRVLSLVRGKLVPLPINVDTINLLYNTNYSSETIQEFYDRVSQPDIPVTNAKEMVIKKIGNELYELFFKEYTRKQWGLDAEMLDPEVTARIPIRYNRDDRYFEDRYQGMPRFGYTRMITNMLDHPQIHVMLNADFAFVKDKLDYDRIIYTGPIDAFFDYKHGKLPYRSLEFQFETLDCNYYQTVATVNYPNDYDFTRITEFKHMTGQVHPKTAIVREYPCAAGEPYYPIPKAENKALYAKYHEEAETQENLYFTGRLGLYQYLNMDVVVKEAMELVEKLLGRSLV
ncbi:MAG TPA: UDP-galactopyranose mutase [Bacillota bacterium]|jgi:UDP-galactopyranose mutase|nr:UDP-galactopyranose mutase [Bacillota bacterium]HOL10717.1 UDP-galactopyranose mutase [Bacillota bacterium]HPO98525.1 UDP-galactopyranose mutase [Bacillota bacterium]